ncbi:MFS general substrate transporter [Coprinopsis marcescibilis]|uniref:MFS general substrate transporter n=1 Tax=Coprinopsis marcescibilis TaxID=230819 RepID=A0A5C3KZR6_COPMA|nr:MFS general substrate transporter [Coprinopsis marcescibilis]
MHGRRTRVARRNPRSWQCIMHVPDSRMRSCEQNQSEMADIGPSNERSPLLQRQRRSESEERPETETYELFITIPISRTTALSLGVFLSVLFSSSLHGLSLAYLPLPRYRQLGNPLYWERMILTTCSLPVGCIGALLGAGNVNQYGIRKLYILALSTLTFGAALIVVAPTWPIFIFARIVQSIACGPVMSLATATFVKMHAVEERGSMIGYLQLAYIVGLGYSVGVGTGGCEYSVSPSLNCSGFAGYRAPVPWRFYAFVIAASVGVLALWLRKSLPQDTVAASDDGGRTHAYQVRTPSVNIFLAIYELMKRPRVFLISIISGVPLVYLPSILTMYLNNSDIHDWTNLAVGWYSSCVYLIGAIVGAGLGGSSSDKAVRSRMPHSSPADRLRVPSIATSLFIPLSFIGLFACCLVPFISPKDREAAIGLVTITVSLFLGIAVSQVLEDGGNRRGGAGVCCRVGKG